MICVKIMGGLGNQLFQYASGYGISKNNNKILLIDSSSYTTDNLRNFMLDKYPIKRIFKEPYYKANIHIVDSFEYKPLKFNIHDKVYLEGYFQSEKYFKEYRKDILKMFKPSKKFLKNIPKRYSFIASSEETLSVHIRRGDYLNSNGYHPIQSLEYYEEAIKRIPHKHLVVFSDDLEWCKNNLKYENMTFVDGLEDFEEIWLMSLCKNNIIANSSFSWWGAWLNENPSKRVIAPKKWFGDFVNLPTKDIYADGFEAI